MSQGLQRWKKKERRQVSHGANRLDKASLNKKDRKEKKSCKRSELFPEACHKKSISGTLTCEGGIEQEWQDLLEGCTGPRAFERPALGCPQH